MRWRTAGLVAALLAAPGVAQNTPYQVGEPLPELRLPTIDGARTIDLAQSRGKRLLLIEFASWRAGCRASVLVWHAFTQRFREEGLLEVVGWRCRRRCSSWLWRSAAWRRPRACFPSRPSRSSRESKAPSPAWRWHSRAS